MSFSRKKHSVERSGNGGGVVSRAGECKLIAKDPPYLAYKKNYRFMAYPALGSLLSAIL